MRSPNLERVYGTIASFQSKRGFGIITPESGGESVFVHWTQILSTDKWPQLAKGTPVEYTPGTNEEGKAVALNVSSPGGGAVSSQPDPAVLSRVLSDFTVIGEVIEFEKRSGVGFVVCQDELPWPQIHPAGSRIIVSREDLVVAEGSSANLHPGMEVEFRVFQSEQGVQAAEITGPGGEPVKIDKVETKNKGAKGGKGWGGPIKEEASTGGGKGKGKGLQHVTFARPVGAWDSSGAPPENKAGKLRFPWQTNQTSVIKTIQKTHGREALPIGAKIKQEQCDRFIKEEFLGDDDLDLDEAFRNAPPQERAAAEALMQHAMLQAAQAHEAILQARQMVRGAVQAREFTDSFGNTLLGSDQDPALLGNDALERALLMQMQNSEGGGSYSQGGAGDGRAPSGQRKIPCRFFAEGRCNKGTSCAFSHDPESYAPKSLDQKTNMPCTFYEQGKCSRGEACPFAHGQQELFMIEQLKGLAPSGTRGGSQI